jgi:uncharacterized coiled-coil protein SlyX
LKVIDIIIMDMYELFTCPNVVTVCAMLFMMAYVIIVDAQRAQAAAATEEAATAATAAVDTVKLNRVQEVVYQLVGGLFDPHTQSKIQNRLINNLFNLPHDVNDEEIDSSERFLIYPTTRQGDQLNDRCDRFFGMMETVCNRISMLESRSHNQHDTIDDMIERVYALEEKVREQEKTIAAQQKQIDETTF